MALFFLSLGSNKGDRHGYLKEAIRRLAIEAGEGAGVGSKVSAVASLYETSPVGYVHQAYFLNTAVAVEVETDPPAMLAICKRIEQDLGRDTPFRWGPREVDLDLVWWGERSGGAGSHWREQRWESAELVIPHPRATERRFVLIPLAEIAPGLPIHGRPVESWIAHLERLEEQDGQLVRQIAAAPQWYAGAQD